jgi:predicted glycoside hydrolase/deacetylase ChbG (UPF0249 family)
MKNLIITGDDFGASPQVNEAVERLHRAGVLTQAGLMVGAPHVDEAVRIARRNPSLCVGLHLVLCDSRPAWNGLRFFFDPRTWAGLEEKIAAQFARFAELGFEPLCWDGHMHLHLHPAVFDIVLPVAAAHQFRMARLVRETRSPHPLALVFRALSARAAPRLKTHGMLSADHTLGLTRTGRMDTQTTCALLRGLRDGWTELYLHPGAERDEWDCAQIADAIAVNGATLRSGRELALGGARDPRAASGDPPDAPGVGSQR